MRILFAFHRENNYIKNIFDHFKKKSIEIIFVYSNQEIKEFLNNIIPDIILTEFKSENIDALEFCEYLRFDRNNYLIPYIVIDENINTDNKILAFKAGVDDIITDPSNIAEVEARIENIVKRFHVNKACNPLTGLPGNVSIEWEIKKIIKSQRKYAVSYLDMDYFKAYNDKYGYEQGDQVILLLSEIIKDILYKIGNKRDFLGHIGGDDFIIITDFNDVINIIESVIREFDIRIRSMYSQQDRERGYIEVKNRRGEIQKFNIISLSVGIAHNSIRVLNNPVQISEILAELKQFAKRDSSSSYAIDRRSS